MPRRFVGLLLGLAACQGAGGAMVGGAVLNTAIAGGAAAYSRHQGGCYASCPVGTTCNGATGYCDELPCRGQCNYGEECDSSGIFQRCVPAGTATPDLSVQGKPSLPPRPAEADPDHPL